MSYRSGNPRLAARNNSYAADPVDYGSHVAGSNYAYAGAADPVHFDDDISTGSSALAAAKASRKKRKRKIITVFVVILALVLGLGGAAYAFIYNLDQNLHSKIDSSLFDALIPVDTPSDPFYILLLGTDGSAERSASAEYAHDSYRSDSLMLARIDPDNKKVTLVSIPRDTEVDLGTYGKQKINAAHAYGGPALAVKTVSELAGVPIAHYAELNFDSFRAIVDALGGVDVNVPMEIDDWRAGGYVASGEQTIDGDQALILCRSRHNYDEYGDGDSYRSANQRMVLSAIAQKLLAVDPFSLANTVTTLTEYAITDLSVSEIVAIAQNMKGLNAQTDIYTGIAPTTSEYKNGGWYEILNKDEFKAMMKRVNAGLPPTEEDIVDSATGIVISSTGSEDGAAAEAFNKTYYNITRNAEINLRNGCGRDGVCASAQDILKEMGYRDINSSNANSFDYDQTLVIYKDNKMANEAQQISQMLGVGKAMADNGKYLFDSDFLIVIGSDWPE